MATNLDKATHAAIQHLLAQGEMTREKFRAVDDAILLVDLNETRSRRHVAGHLWGTVRTGPYRDLVLSILKEISPRNLEEVMEIIQQGEVEIIRREG